MTDKKNIFKSDFATAMDDDNNIKFLYVNATPKFKPLFVHTGMTHLNSGTIYRLPFPLSAEHKQALKCNNKVSEFHYV